MTLRAPISPSCRAIRPKTAGPVLAWTASLAAHGAVLAGALYLGLAADTPPSPLMTVDVVIAGVEPARDSGQAASEATETGETGVQEAQSQPKIAKKVPNPPLPPPLERPNAPHTPTEPALEPEISPEMEALPVDSPPAEEQDTSKKALEAAVPPEIPHVLEPEPADSGQSAPEMPRIQETLPDEPPALVQEPRPTDPAPPPVEYAAITPVTEPTAYDPTPETTAEQIPITVVTPVPRPRPAAVAMPALAALTAPAPRAKPQRPVAPTAPTQPVGQTSADKKAPPDVAKPTDVALTDVGPGKSELGKSPDLTLASAAAEPAPRRADEADAAARAGASSLPSLSGGTGNRAPQYPEIARERGWEGRVVLRVEVDPNGKTDALTVKRSSGHNVLDRAALAAVREWRFNPARRSGQPVAGAVDVPISFRLHN